MLMSLQVPHLNLFCGAAQNQMKKVRQTLVAKLEIPLFQSINFLVKMLTY
jgi:hypothetical protein